MKTASVIRFRFPRGRTPREREIIRTAVSLYYNSRVSEHLSVERYVPEPTGFGDFSQSCSLVYRYAKSFPLVKFNGKK